MNGAQDAARPRAVAVVATLALAAVAWVVAVGQMAGMDMGVATRLGSFTFFIVLWVSMMAAMMLPGAVVAVARRARAGGRLGAGAAFVGAYLAVWTLVGVAVYAVYRPHGPLAAGVVAIAAGLYEVTPVKRHFRRCGRQEVRSGFEFGLYCVGSSIALMLLLVAVGLMSVGWMVLVAALVAAQKLWPPRAAVDVALALALVAVGVAMVVAPEAVPGLTPPM